MLFYYFIIEQVNVTMVNQLIVHKLKSGRISFTVSRYDSHKTGMEIELQPILKRVFGSTFEFCGQTIQFIFGSKKNWMENRTEKCIVCTAPLIYIRAYGTVFEMVP